MLQPCGDDLGEDLLVHVQTRDRPVVAARGSLSFLSEREILASDRAEGNLPLSE